jgi:hypothetical protein
MLVLAAPNAPRLGTTYCLLISLKTVELGMRSSFATARPVSPRALNLATLPRCALTVSGRPSLTPRFLAAAKPARMLSVAAACLNSSIASRTLRNALLDNLEMSTRAGIIKNGLVRDKVSEPRHTPREPIQIRAKHNANSTGTHQPHEHVRVTNDPNVIIPASSHGVIPKRIAIRAPRVNYDHAPTLRGRANSFKRQA